MAYGDSWDNCPEPKEHLGKKVFLAVAQQPFERVGESGFANNFATLVPLLTTDGQVLDLADFRHYGLVFWMVRQHALRFSDPGRLIAGKLEQAVNPQRLEYQLAPDSVEVVQPSSRRSQPLSRAVEFELRRRARAAKIKTADHTRHPRVFA